MDRMSQWNDHIIIIIRNHNTIENISVISSFFVSCSILAVTVAS